MTPPISQNKKLITRDLISPIVHEANRKLNNLQFQKQQNGSSESAETSQDKRAKSVESRRDITREETRNREQEKKKPPTLCECRQRRRVQSADGFRLPPSCFVGELELVPLRIRVHFDGSLNARSLRCSIWPSNLALLFSFGC